MVEFVRIHSVCLQMWATAAAGDEDVNKFAFVEMSIPTAVYKCSESANVLSAAFACCCCCCCVM